MHRDLKPQNILVSNAKNVEIKLTDFGFATFFDEDEKLDLPLGTPYYLSPEIVKEEKYDQKCDIWSAGVIMYEMLQEDPACLAVPVVPGQDREITLGRTKVLWFLPGAFAMTPGWFASSGRPRIEQSSAWPIFRTCYYSYSDSYYYLCY